jgi:non-ribosomal peptide synthetase component E (peptide arylation enzyme)
MIFVCRAEKLAEAQAASAADQAAVTTAEAKMAYAPLMQNVQMAANLNTQTVLAGSPARRPAFV